MLSDLIRRSQNDHRDFKEAVRKEHFRKNAIAQELHDAAEGQRRVSAALYLIRLKAEREALRPRYVPITMDDLKNYRV